MTLQMMLPLREIAPITGVLPTVPPPVVCSSNGDPILAADIGFRLLQPAPSIERTLHLSLRRDARALYHTVS